MQSLPLRVFLRSRERPQTTYFSHWMHGLFIQARLNKTITYFPLATQAEM